MNGPVLWWRELVKQVNFMPEIAEMREFDNVLVGVV